MANDNMANEVYLLTHSELSQMVSSRVATRFLDKALDAKGYSADSVSSEEMREILQGPILRELRQILPKDGVERSIKQISRNLRKQAEKVAEAALAVASASASDGFRGSSNLPMVSGDVLLTDDDELVSPERVLNFEEATDDLGVIQHSSPLEDKGAFDTSEVEAALAHVLDATPEENTPVASPIVHEVKQPESPAVSPAKTNRLQAELSPEDLAKMLVNFAQLENVKLVAAVRPNGEVSMARGSGLDVDALSRLGSLGIKLLSRGRTIRSYYLSNSRYQLFLFPLASHTLIVVGSSEVNVGEVFNTRSQLESHLEEEV